MNYQYKYSDFSPNKVEIHMGLLSKVENTSQLIIERNFIIWKKPQRLGLGKLMEVQNFTTWKSHN